ncbi:hypothetical protein GOP47_0016795 [Adiantum capillus-veneris]|uniref:Uncharacterized protein n=1 Tax=Adiantum capillus-veneris TaxID=13818 RepID=A0A9D4UIE8_ADICA|nr:hypothetical protein GOP47_0016795 [Adiantum capillus-veneris]
MACPRCGLCSKLDTLEGNVVDLYSRSAKSIHSLGLAKRAEATTEGRCLQDFDTKAQKKLMCSLPSRSLQGGLPAVRRLQKKTSNNPNASRNISLQSTISTNPKYREHRTLAFVLHDEDFTNEPLGTKLSYDHSDKLKPFPLESVEMQAFHTAAAHVSPLLYTRIAPVNTNPSYAAKDFADGIVSDLDDSEESEREVEGAICLSSFTFGSTKYLPPSLGLIARGKKSLVRKLSSESCISMLSLDCTDGELSADRCVESVPSGDLSLQAEMTGISVSRANSDDEVNMVEPSFRYRGSGNIGFHWKPNLDMKSEAIKFNGVSLPPLEKIRSKGQQQEDLRSETHKKKRLRSATHERHRMTRNNARKASLNLRPCGGLAGLISGGTDVYRAFNLGVGIGVAYILFANWNELKKLNLLLERTESLVRDLQQQAPSRSSPLLGCFSTVERYNHREPVNNVEASKLEGCKADVADEPMSKSRNMAELEAALEAELAVMQHNLEAELQVSPGGSDECDVNNHARTEEYMMGNIDQGGTSNSSAKNDTVHVQHMVSPNTLNKRLREVLELQQEERILHLEAQIEARELDLLMKEKELQFWKDIAHHLVNALPAKRGGRTEGYTIDQGGLGLAGEGSRAQQGLSDAKHDARHRPLPLKCEEFKVSGCTTASRRRVLDYESLARSDFFCESVSNSLIDPSFEALTLRNSLDWSIGAQSAEAEWRKEDYNRSSHNDHVKDLDVDKMFPWLLQEECLAEAPHFGDSGPFTNSSLKGGFVRKDSYHLNGLKGGLNSRLLVL